MEGRSSDQDFHPLGNTAAVVSRRAARWHYSRVIKRPAVCPPVRGRRRGPGGARPHARTRAQRGGEWAVRNRRLTAERPQLAPRYGLGAPRRHRGIHHPAIPVNDDGLHIPHTRERADPLAGGIGSRIIGLRTSQMHPLSTATHGTPGAGRGHASGLPASRRRAPVRGAHGATHDVEPSEQPERSDDLTRAPLGRWDGSQAGRTPPGLAPRALPQPWAALR